jgi:hypothetical protein
MAVSVVFSGTYTENGGEGYASGTVALTPRGGSTTTATLDGVGHYSTTLTVEGTFTVVETITGQAAKTKTVYATNGATVDTSRDIGVVIGGPGASAVVSVNGQTGAIDLTGVYAAGLAPRTGVAATDQAIVQGAIDAAATAGGGTIRGAGTYDGLAYVVTGLRMKSRVTLSDVSIKLADASNVDVVVLDSDTVERAGLVRCHINGNKANQSSGGGINFTNTADATAQAAASATANQDPRHLIEDVLVINTKGVGVKLIGRGESRLRSVNTWKCDGKGFHIGAADITASECSAGDSGLQGWFFSAAGGADSGSNFKGTNLYSWFSGRITAASGQGVEIQAKQVYITGLACQDNQKHGLALSGCQDATITGYVGDSNNNDATNASSGQNGSGVYMTNADRCSVDGNCLDRNGTPIQRYALEFGTGNTFNRIRLGSRNMAGGHVNGDTSTNDVEILAAANTVQTITYAASVTPDPYAGQVKIITLTGALTLANPVARHVGQRLRFVLIQDGTGGRVTTFGSDFAASWLPDTSANTVNTASFTWDGTKWRQESWSTSGSPGALPGYAFWSGFSTPVSTVNAWSLQQSSVDYFGGKNVSSGTQNDGMVLPGQGLRAGTYALDLFHRTGSTGAIITLDYSSDGGTNWTTLGTTIDAYNAGGGPLKSSITGIALVDGRYLWRLRALAKNASNVSSNYHIQFCALALTRVSA